MNVYGGAYGKSIAANDVNLAQWIAQRDKLMNLNLDQFSEKLSVPILVPIGSRIMFRGEIVHTNEVTVSMGANYFAKCTVKQAKEIQQHRIAVAEAKIQDLETERNYLEQHVEFAKKNVFGANEEEIIEPFNEEEDRKWREKHRCNMKKFKLESKTDETDKSDAELWQQLDELELREEMEELISKENELNQSEEINHLEKKEVDLSETKSRKDVINERIEEEKLKTYEEELEKSRKLQEIVQEIGVIDNETNKELDIAQITRRRKDVEEKLTKLRETQDNGCQSEADVMRRLDQLEEEERLEEELDRLDDLRDAIASNHAEEVSDDDESSPHKLKRSVSFAEDHDSECIQIEFKHSPTAADTSQYNRANGFQKPSDIYDAFPECLEGGKRIVHSILKKYINSCQKSVTLNGCSVNEDELGEGDHNMPTSSNDMPTSSHDMPTSNHDMPIGGSINILGDIVEHSGVNEVVSEEPVKKISKFKEMRLQRLNKK